jgi:hypothetical protein
MMYDRHRKAYEVLAVAHAAKAADTTKSEASKDRPKPASVIEAGEMTATIYPGGESIIEITLAGFARKAIALDAEETRALYALLKNHYDDHYKTKEQQRKQERP